jgi:8-oxo-dGTP pyrophosphatase MutT (NUDIX family)
MMSETTKKRDNTERWSLAAKLDRVMAALREAVLDNSSLAARLDSLRGRLRHNRLHLAVLGQFKRGKSTFINALLGAPLLPVAVVPLTAVPIFISWRPAASVRVRFSDDRLAEEFSADDPKAIQGFLFRFVAEEANPANRLGVERVDLFYPAPILRDGTVLIDTPGVGSTLRHNTDAALRVLPECDAVLFVVSADPPITEAELEYLRRFESKAAKTVFALNKIDYLRPEEQSRVVDFLYDVLEKNGLWSHDTTIFGVSARNGLEAKEQGDRTEWQRSGMAGVETYLARYLVEEKTSVLEHAILSKALDILSQAVAEVTLRIRTLEIPLDALASKAQAFEEALRSIEERRRITHDLLAGDQRRLREDLERRIGSLRNEASTKLAAIVNDEIAANPGIRSELDQLVLASTMEQMFDAARGEFAKELTGEMDSVLSIHQRRIDGLIDTVRQTATEIFDVPFRQRFETDSFQFGEEPYWVTGHIEAGLIPDACRLTDRLLTKALRARSLRSRLIVRANELIVRNAENLRWAILRGIDEAFRQAGRKFEERLDDAIATTRSLIQKALTRRREQAGAVDSDLKRLNGATRKLAKLQEELAEEADDFVQSGSLAVSRPSVLPIQSSRTPVAVRMFGEGDGVRPNAARLMTPTAKNGSRSSPAAVDGWSINMARSSSARDKPRSPPSGTGIASLKRRASVSDDRNSSYRPGVGIVLLNARGEIFVGRRTDVPGEAWQMPQGGIDDRESPREAARRELKEEIGTNNAEIIAESERWLTYDVPEEFARKSWGGRWKGQRQKWFVMLFKGADSDIDLQGNPPEFNVWRWVMVNELTALAVAFKRQLYLEVIGEFPAIFRD